MMNEQKEVTEIFLQQEMPHEKIIYLVRHGETEWNKQNRLQGSRDSPLTSNGIKQAYKAKENLQILEIDHAYVSPLKRAKDTMDIILKDSEIVASIKNNLREMNLGPWEGKTRQEISHSYPDEYIAFCEKQNLFKLPGADTFQDLQNRVVDEFESIFANEKNTNSLVVSHWITIKVAVAYYSSIPLSNLSEIPDPANGGFLCLLKRDRNIFIVQE